MIRAGATALLAVSLVWPATSAQADPTPSAPAEVEASASSSTASMSGRVTDGTGAPLEGVDVEVSGGGGSTQTAADGTWEAADLDAGPVVVRFILRGPAGQLSSLYWDGTAYGTHAFTWAPPLEEGEVRDGVDVTFVDNTVTGVVTAGGVPVAGATVGLSRSAGDSSQVRTVTTSDDGTWTARWVAPGVYSVRVTPPAGSGLAPAWWNHSGNSYGTVYFAGATARTQSAVDVDLAAESRLTGRVVDEAGQPASGVAVALWSGRVRPIVVEKVVTGADGAYAFGGLDAGDYTVQIARPSPSVPGPWSVVPEFLGGVLAHDRAVWVKVAAQDDVAVGDLVRRIGGTISGTVVGDPGWDGPGISVEFLDAAGSVVARAPAQDRATGADFESPSALPAGVYRMRAAMPGDGYWWVGGTSFETARTLDVRPGYAITDVELILSDAYVGTPPIPSEVLTNDNRGGLSVAAPVVTGGTVAISGLQDPGLSYVWLFSSPQGLGYAQVAADGTLQVTIPTGVAPGPHRLAVTTPGGNLLGWADLTVVAAAGPGAAPVDPPAAAPGAAAGSAAASTPARSETRSPGAGARGSALAATGADVLWMAGSALAIVLLGGALVVLRRRRTA
ncbi:carboxypeptidase-like regulatory domain-containing protein [Cellulomonas chengniuliangii]|uniref:carboxypeptidase-like regulatory domain-containing protein n=1 Tax=Cellulomonas chengniuliangii TaxID=2968084 RepID=UPI001D0EF4AF|nr:carboxypeptidase-like regulatory domain-containing protein [Cellulomonas chengniuliangii]MCC2318469.1 carboxypeptidase-like regulatory domain-containing protein [Cellulomonas chengniuliangii]